MKSVIIVVYSLIIALILIMDARDVAEGLQTAPDFDNQLIKLLFHVVGATASVTIGLWEFFTGDNDD